MTQFASARPTPWNASPHVPAESSGSGSPPPAAAAPQSLQVLARIPRLADSPESTGAGQDLAGQSQRLSPSDKPVELQASDSATSTLSEELATLSKRRQYMIQKSWHVASVLVLLTATGLFLNQLRQNQQQRTQQQPADSVAQVPPDSAALVELEGLTEQDAMSPANQSSVAESQKSEVAVAERPQRVADATLEPATPSSHQDSETPEPATADEQRLPTARAIRVVALPQVEDASTASEKKTPAAYPSTSFPVVSLDRLQDAIQSSGQSNEASPAVAELPGHVEPYTR